MSDHKELLARLMTEMSQATPEYRPTAFWKFAVDSLAKELATDGFERFRSLPGPLNYFVPSYGFPGYSANASRFEPLRQALQRLNVEDGRCATHLERLLSGEAQAESDYRVLLAGDRNCAPFLSSATESTVGAPVEQFTFDGRRFSRSFLNYLLGITFLKQHCDAANIRTVMEIGGGFGSLGEVLLSDPRNNVFYIDVDIPPTLNAAAYYLSQVFGGDIAVCSDERDIKTLAQTKRAALFAPWHLPTLVGSVDLFVNFVSFQEMEPSVVENYLRHVARLGARFVLLRNLREGKAKAKSADEPGVLEPIRGEMYDGFLQAYRLIAATTRPFGYVTVDGFHSELRLYQRQ